MSSFIYRPDVYAMATQFSVENMCWCKILGVNDRKRKKDWPKMSWWVLLSNFGVMMVNTDWASGFFILGRTSLGFLRQEIENGKRVDYLLFLVVDPVNWVDIRLDGVPAGDPHLADQVHRDEEEQGKDTGQGGETDDCIEEGVV